MRRSVCRSLRPPPVLLRATCGRPLRAASADVTGLPSRAELGKLSIKDLKILAARRKMSTHDCVEKAQIIDKILGTEAVPTKTATRGKGGLLSTTEYRVAAAVALLLLFYAGKVAYKKWESAEVRELRTKVKGGDIEAMCALSQKLYTGDGALVDVDAAFQLLKQAAKGGNPWAMTELGAMYCRGEGTPNNEKLYAPAYELFLKAAMAGHRNAMYNLAEVLERGVGCERSQERADRWRLKAVQTLDLKAEANLRNASYEQDVLRPKASQ